MKAALVLFVAVAGVLNTIQSGSNATLNKLYGRPVWAMVTVFAVAFATSLVIALASGQKPPLAAGLVSVPWWAWIGGAFGAIYILSMMLTADKLGAAVFMGLTVTTAVITSLVMDHFGLLGFEVHKAGVARIAGGLLMVGGLALIARY